MIKKLTEALRTHETKIVIAVGLTIVASTAYVFGHLHGQGWQPAPLVIEKPVVDCAAQENNDLPELAQDDIVSGTVSDAACPFVGSQRGSVYYPPTCAAARKILPENLRCFASREDAQRLGYRASASCP